MKFIRFFFALSLLAQGVLFSARAAAVAFDDFQYTGNDPQPIAKMGANTYRNPILAGFYPDPSVCRVGNDYYLINSTFAYFPGIPIFHSRDLVNWTQIGNVISRPDQLSYNKLGVSRGIFAPSISYAKGVYYVICTMADAGGNFVVTAANPQGPWSNPTWLEFEGIDPSIFFDDDGRAWVVNNGAPAGTPLYSGHRAIWIQEFDPVKKKMFGPRTVLVNGGVDIKQKPVWIEGPHIYKYHGWYFLCCAEGGTGTNHSQVILSSKDITGPYVSWDQNPILTQRGLDASVPFAVTSTGHANLVVGPDNKWWAVFLGVRPYEKSYSPMGRETFLLPVSWTNHDWPMILKKGERVSLVGRTPEHAQAIPSREEPLNGNFTWQAKFTSTVLEPAWLMLRTPSETWWEIDPLKNRLLLTPRATTLAGDGNPSFLARRVQHANFTASTSLEIPSDANVSAGLAVFQSEHDHYFLAVKKPKDQILVYLEKYNGAGSEVVRSIRCPSASKIELRVEVHDAICAFSYSIDSQEWKILVADQDAKLFTTEVAGGFVGATVGMHARIDQ